MREKKSTTPYRCVIVQITKKLPKQEQNKVPKYYAKREMLSQISLWIKLVKILPVDGNDLNNYRVVSSGMAVLSTLQQSMAPLFIIERGKQSKRGGYTLRSEEGHYGEDSPDEFEFR